MSSKSIRGSEETFYFDRLDDGSLKIASVSRGERVEIVIPSEHVHQMVKCVGEVAGESAPKRRAYRNTGSRRPFRCHNCGMTGHRASECENERTCRNCGMTGHLMKDCENSPKCYNCSEFGHISADCPNEKKETGRKCYNCQEFGHISADCPNEKKETGRKCYNCQEFGHISADCPNEKKDF
eukprot:TRINITY_DN452_c0_g1_i1.p1 TRINITY_DN452_c0_g1~~TRINITY_DN452_c0_g1_i1.p1  ORF type:complete len:182 (-),score=35.23 TRINITY_DN452_c0_g1_i1:390-935(-)